jgi:hypothetical protein
VFQAIALVLGGGGAASGRSLVESVSAGAAAVAVLARISDFAASACAQTCALCPSQRPSTPSTPPPVLLTLAADLQPGSTPITRGPAYDARMTRIAALGSGGIYRAALAGLSTPGLAESEVHATAVVSLIARLLSIPGVDAVRLGLNKASLLALQVRAGGARMAGLWALIPCSVRCSGSKRHRSAFLCCC